MEVSALVKSNWKKLNTMLKNVFDDFGDVMRQFGLEDLIIMKRRHTSEHNFLEAMFTLGDLPILGTGGEAQKLGRGSLLQDRKLAKLFNTS